MFMRCLFIFAPVTVCLRSSTAKPRCTVFCSTYGLCSQRLLASGADTIKLLRHCLLLLTRCFSFTSQTWKAECWSALDWMAYKYVLTSELIAWYQKLGLLVQVLNHMEVLKSSILLKFFRFCKLNWLAGPVRLVPYKLWRTEMSHSNEKP